MTGLSAPRFSTLALTSALLIGAALSGCPDLVHGHTQGGQPGALPRGDPHTLRAPLEVWGFALDGRQRAETWWHPAVTGAALTPA